MRKPEEFVIFNLKGKPQFVYDKIEIDEYLKHLRGSSGKVKKDD